MTPGDTSARRAAILTLGCRLNQTESALIADDLARHGYALVPWSAPAEVRVINSCGVTAEAVAKTRKAVHAARRRWPEAVLALVGCAAEIDPATWAAEDGADLVVGNVVKNRLGEALPADGRRPDRPRLLVGHTPPRDSAPEAFEEAGAGLFHERTRAALKIQEGCDFHCSYCIVPTLRGAARSRRWDDCLREAAALLERGHREIVLTGVNIATYRDRGRDLADLARAVLDLDPAFRLRLGSTEPGPALPRVVELLAAEPRLCRFLHLPMQYGDDAILKAMNRRYTLAEFEDLAWSAVRAAPGLGLGSDIIVGFPGETEKHFEACCEAVRRLPLTHLHVFTYSARQGTPAATFPHQVPGTAAAERAAAMARLGRAKAAAFAQAQIGQRLSVLTESRAADGRWQGWSENYIRVRIQDGDRLDANRIVGVRIDRLDPDGKALQGHLDDATA